MVFQARADVVGGQNGGFGGVRQAVGAHHADVHPADRQHGGVAQGGGTDGTDALGGDAARCVAGQEGHQVFDHADRADAGATAAVRDAKGLVQVQMAHVTAEFAGGSGANQRIHIGAVHVHPATKAVHQGAEFLDLRLKHAMGAGVGDHDAGQVGGVLFALGLQIGHVHIALVVAAGDDHLQARHLRAGRVGAVGAGRDEADGAVALALACVVGANRQQTGVFPLGASIGLQADAGIAGGRAQPGAQLCVQLGIARALRRRRKRVDVGKFGPGDGNHLAGGVELHGATAQRNHAAVQRQILVRQHADVAQHAGFGVVGVEYRVRQKGAGAAQGRGDQPLHLGLQCIHRRQGLAIPGKETPECGNIVTGGGFIQRNA